MDSPQTEPGQRLGVFSISTESLLKMFLFPEGYKLRTAYLNPYGTILELVVEHESLPLTIDLEALPQVIPIYQTVFREECPHHVPELVEIKIEANR